jgi:hypothetical protein
MRGVYLVRASRKALATDALVNASGSDVNGVSTKPFGRWLLH